MYQIVKDAIESKNARWHQTVIITLPSCSGPCVHYVSGCRTLYREHLCSSRRVDLWLWAIYRIAKKFGKWEGGGRREEGGGRREGGGGSDRRVVYREEGVTVNGGRRHITKSGSEKHGD